MILGIDTSNYTTSVALVNPQGEIVADVRRLLEVKPGARGLRQQEALFQHVKNLPILLEKALESIQPQDIEAVAVSTAPRRVEGSYMPVFMAGESFARSIASALKVPCFTFSHQEGHMAAICSPLKEEALKPPFYAFHLSGGTCELLHAAPRYVEKEGKEPVFDGYDTTILGGSQDISFGQLLDRIGVAMGYGFPAGATLDQMALGSGPSKRLTRVKVKDRAFHLSGTETQALRLLETLPQEEKGSLAAELFQLIARTIKESTKGLSPVILVGGVAESRTLQQLLAPEDHIFIESGGKGRDNAIGIAALGGRKLWGLPIQSQN